MKGLILKRKWNDQIIEGLILNMMDSLQITMQFFLTVVRNSQQKINWFMILTKKENFECEDKLNTCL